LTTIGITTTHLPTLKTLFKLFPKFFPQYQQGDKNKLSLIIKVIMVSMDISVIEREEWKENK
jgi:hypothetical protein